MRVKLIRKASIVGYINSHAHSKTSLDTFQYILKHADWETPDDIAFTFGSNYDIVCNGKRIVFDVGGNTYRIICGTEF